MGLSGIGELMVGGLSGSEVEGVETKALFATVDGTIGIVASLSEEKFLLLEKVEKKMEEQDMSLGGIEHARYPLPLKPFPVHRHYENKLKQTLYSRNLENSKLQS